MTVDPLCPYWCHGEWEKTMVAFHRTGLSNRPHQNSSTRLISNDFRLGLNQRHNTVRVVELCGQPEPLSENSLRSLQGLHPCHRRRRCPQHPARASVGAGKDGRRAHRLHQGQSRQGELRFRRHRHDAAFVRRAVPPEHEARHRTCAIRRRRAGDPIARRRPYADGVHLATARDPADPGRQDPPARGIRRKARRGAARRADARRGRSCGPGGR